MNTTLKSLLFVIVVFIFMIVYNLSAADGTIINLIPAVVSISLFMIPVVSRIRSLSYYHKIKKNGIQATGYIKKVSSTSGKWFHRVFYYPIISFHTKEDIEIIGRPLNLELVDINIFKKGGKRIVYYLPNEPKRFIVKKWSLLISTIFGLIIAVGIIIVITIAIIRQYFTLPSS